MVNEFWFKNEEQKDTWIIFKNNISEIDDFAHRLINIVETWGYNIQVLLGDMPENIIFKENWDERNKAIFTTTHLTIQSYQEALNAETLYESKFQEIINIAFELSNTEHLTNSEIECIENVLCSIWKYGDQLRFELKRKKTSAELKEKLAIQNNPLIYGKRWIV
ncbi:MAG: hypothetical protein Q4G05_05515 [Clostridia bacterium]|nr:hypothetical protein [Clostridia bacterium]